MKAFSKQNVVFKECGAGMISTVEIMLQILAEDPKCEVVMCEIEGISLGMRQGETVQLVYNRFSQLKSAALHPPHSTLYRRRAIAR